MKRLVFVVLMFVLTAVAVPAAGAQEATPEASPVAGSSVFDSTTDRAAGDAFEFIPDGAENVVSVVLQAPVQNGGLVVVVRNETTLPVSDVAVQVAVKTADGQLFAAGKVTISPYVLIPNGVGFGNVMLNAEVPADATFEYQVTVQPVSLTPYRSDFAFTQQSRIDERILGEAKNIGPNTVSLGIVEALCFVDGQISGISVAPMLSKDIPPGGTSLFQIDLYVPCEQYILAVL